MTSSQRTANQIPQGLHAYAIFMAVATFILIIAGGLVTSTGSGLAVPDWPLANGQWFPPMVGGVLFEHGHRMVATVIGFLTVVMAVWLWAGHARRELKVAGAWAVGIVIAQGILGGLTVLLRLPVLVSTAHATLGQAFFAITVCLAILTDEKQWHEVPVTVSNAAKVQRLAILATAFILLQLIIGAIYRHSGHLLHLHMLNAFIVAVHVVLVGLRVVGVPNVSRSLNRPAIALLSLLVVQLLLGLLAWRIPTVYSTTCHVAVGALLLAASVVLSVQVFRKMVPA